MTATTTATTTAWIEVWRARDLLRSLAARNLKVKYQRSALGFLWTLLNPLLTLTVLAAVFTHVVKIQVPAYWAFLLSGYFVWNFLFQMLSTASYVLAEHAGLRRSVAFPSEVLLLSATVSRLVELALELALVLAALAAFHHSAVPASFSLLPLLVVLLILLALGLALPLSVLAAFYNDVQHALPVVLMVLFYASPVFYPASLVPPDIRRFYFLNPIAGLLTLFHEVLYEGRFPSPALLGGVAAASAILFVCGYAVFNRYKTVLAEIL